MSYLAFFTFKKTHRDRHYLMNPFKNNYQEAISRDHKDAFPFDTDFEAETAIVNLLAEWDYGRDKYTDYSYVGYVLDTETNSVELCAEAY